MSFLKLNRYLPVIRKWLVSLFLLVVFPVVAQAEPMAARQLWAVVIGIRDYPYISGVKKAEFAENDARAVKKSLVNRLGFPPEQTFLFTGKQADRLNIARFLHADLPKRMPPGSSLFIFFAGRTIMNKHACYLLLSDFHNVSFEKGALPLRLLLRLAYAAKPKKFFLVLAAPCKEKVLITASDISLPDPLSPGRWALFAGDEKETDIGIDGISLFSSYFMEGLAGDADSNRDNMISVSELETSIAPKLWKDYKQVLQYGKLRGSGDWMFTFPLSAGQVQESSHKPIKINSEFYLKTGLTRPALAKDFPRTKIPLNNSAPLEMILLPAGTYMMGGGRELGIGDDLPSHKVSLSSFWLGVYEVTQQNWEAVMGYNTSDRQGANLPVVRVDWFDTQLFISRLNKMTGGGFRLPTEAEWEYACRTGINLKYAFDDGDMMLNKHAWVGENSRGKIHPVGRKLPNNWGLYDMYGNVWELCQDWYDEHYYKVSPAHNPVNRTRSLHKVMRGGFYGAKAHRIYSSRRMRVEPGVKSSSVGFRLARDVKKVKRLAISSAGK
ncbi:MAG: SUMF1/EgtB/PvdO family nonheme iron enzyme [bacterium]